MPQEGVFVTLVGAGFDVERAAIAGAVENAHHLGEVDVALAARGQGKRPVDELKESI